MELGREQHIVLQQNDLRFQVASVDRIIAYPASVREPYTDVLTTQSPFQDGANIQLYLIADADLFSFEP